MSQNEAKLPGMEAVKDAPRIAAVRIRTVNMPLKKPVRTAAGLVSHAALLLVDLECDNGVVGSTYAFTDTPVALNAIRRLMDDLSPLLLEKTLAPSTLYMSLRRQLRLLGSTGLTGIALAAFDMAAWDALARSANMALVRLLGGEPGAIRAYASFGMADPESSVRDAVKAVEDGFRAIKVKIGYPTLEEDLRVVRAVRRAIGDDIDLLVDYNQSLTPAEAIVRGCALDHEGVAWIEEPVAYDDLTGGTRVASAVRTPIQAGENLWGCREVYKSVMAGASDLMMLDLMKAGGVTGWLKCAAICDAIDMPISSHIFPEVSAQLLCVSPNPHYLERIDLASPLLQNPLRFQAGCAIVTDEPGSGISWNEEAVARYLC